MKWIDKVKSKKILRFATPSFIILFLLSSIIWVNNQEKDQRCTEIKISITPESDLFFLSKEDIFQLVGGRSNGENLIGSKLKKINTKGMENALESNPFVEKADVFVGIDGKITIKVMQRTPVMRVITAAGNGYYVDSKGRKMPLNLDFAAPVVVVNGFIREPLARGETISDSALWSVLPLANFIHNDPFWKAQIEQIYVDNFKDIKLVPLVGNHTIVFGDSENINEKFDLLKSFYINGLSKVGWDLYKEIIVKYKGQIVAVKN